MVNINNWGNLLVDVQTPSWWFSVVLVGILISILGNFLTRVLDSRFKSTFDWWRKRKDAYDLDYQKELSYLCKQPQQEKIFVDEETRLRLKGLEELGKAFVGFFLFLMMSSLFLMPKWVSGIILMFALLSWFLQVRYFSAANRKERLLKEFYSILEKEKGSPEKGLEPSLAKRQLKERSLI